MGPSGAVPGLDFTEPGLRFAEPCVHLAVPGLDFTEPGFDSLRRAFFRWPWPCFLVQGPDADHTEKDGGTRGSAVPTINLRTCWRRFARSRSTWALSCSETFLLVPFRLPGRGDLGQGIVAQADERARLGSLDAEHVLTQQAHRHGRLHHLGERYRTVPGALQGIPRCQPGRQRPVDLPAIKPDEEGLECLRSDGPSPSDRSRASSANAFRPPSTPRIASRSCAGDHPVRVWLVTASARRAGCR